MKNKIKKFFLSTLLLLSFFSQNSYSENFEFTGTELDILENGNLIVGKKGIKVISNNQIIEAKQFEYNKIDLRLKLIGNVKITDSLKNIIINGRKIDYYENEQKFVTEGPVKINIGDKYIIDSNNLTYFKNTEHFFSKSKTSLKDMSGNIFELQNFDYFKLKEKVRGKKVKFTDNQLNEYLIEDALINLASNEIIGKDLIIDFQNSVFGNKENEPRIKGNKIYSNQSITTVSKGIFTTCKKTGNCPPWTMKASEVTHDKKKKIIYYKDAWLNVYDVPVLYFPKFFHPDPTVKRQSGFLIPKISDTTSLGSALEIPYFKVIADNQDLTFKPRIYVDKSMILQSEYRLVNKKSSHIFDFSLFGSGNKSIFSSSDRKNHFFSNSIFERDFTKFNDSQIEINIETTSNDTYLKTYKVESPLIKNKTSLNSYVNLELNNENTYIKSSLESYEDLSKNKNERFEYVYPNIEILKSIDINPDYKGDLNFDVNGYQKKYGTDSFDSVLINNLEFQSFDYILDSGLKNNFNIFLKNVNSNGDNSSDYRDKTNNKLLGSFIFESAYPLKKENSNYTSFLKPIVSLRYSPTETKNIKNSDRRIDINNIFSQNRISSNETMEGGQSLTIGNEYRLTDKENIDEYLFLSIASVFRDQENEDLPTNSTIGQKSSDIVGNAKFSPNKYFNINYDFSLDNNLDTSNYDSIKSTFSVNNFVTSFEYLQEENVIGKKSYIQNDTSFNFNKSNSVGFSTRKNKETNITEFYNLIYQYKNDCLTAGIEYNKEYYDDNDLKPQEQLLFTITIMPFGKVNSPNVNK